MSQLLFLNLLRTKALIRWNLRKVTFKNSNSYHPIAPHHPQVNSRLKIVILSIKISWIIKNNIYKMSKFFFIWNLIYFSYMYIGDGKNYKENGDYFIKGNVSELIKK